MARKTKAQRNQEHADAERRVWEVFRPKLDAATTLADALQLAAQTPPPDPPGKPPALPPPPPGKPPAPEPPSLIGPGLRWISRELMPPRARSRRRRRTAIPSPRNSLAVTSTPRGPISSMRPSPPRRSCSPDRWTAAPPGASRRRRTRWPTGSRSSTTTSTRPRPHSPRRGRVSRGYPGSAPGRADQRLEARPCEDRVLL